MPHTGQPQLLHEGLLQWGRLFSFPESQSRLAGSGCQRRQNISGFSPILPHQQHPHEHVGLTLHQPDQSMGQTATADTSSEEVAGWHLDQHWHQQTLPSLLVGSPRVSQPFPASYPCSLKHKCILPSSDLGQKALLLTAAATQGWESWLCTRIRGFPTFYSLLVQPGWSLLAQRAPYLPGLPAEGKHQHSVFRRSMARSGLDLQAATGLWAQSH